MKIWEELAQWNFENPNEPVVDSFLVWYRENARQLPWRETKDPYRIWLSEIMLQQTRVETVKDYYKRFLLRFPTVFDLAEAPEEAVMKAWEGLGYYSRARNLHRCAKEIAKEGGEFPDTRKALLELPGIGAYTAGAVASFCLWRAGAGRGRECLAGHRAMVWDLGRYYEAPDQKTDHAKIAGTAASGCCHLQPGHDGTGGDSVHPEKPGLRPVSPERGLLCQVAWGTGGVAHKKQEKETQAAVHRRGMDSSRRKTAAGQKAWRRPFGGLVGISCRRGGKPRKRPLQP